MIFLHGVTNLNPDVGCQAILRESLRHWFALFLENCIMQSTKWIISHSLFRPVVHYSVDRKWKWHESETIARRTTGYGTNKLSMTLVAVFDTRAPLLLPRKRFVFCVIYRTSLYLIYTLPSLSLSLSLILTFLIMNVIFYFKRCVKYLMGIEFLWIVIVFMFFFRILFVSSFYYFPCLKWS